VVDDQALMRDGLVSLLSLEHGIAVVGTASNGEEAVKQVVALQPDVILMDVRMPIVDGVAATVQIRRDFSDTPILMLTTFDDDAYVLAALQAGANGYLLKDLPASINWTQRLPRSWSRGSCRLRLHRHHQPVRQLRH
jgi:DNA-binding NarL/FixJ family response regulator